jgi:hypothetical protein
MVIAFPAIAGIPVVDEDVCVVRGLNKEKFNSSVSAKMKRGWRVYEMYSSYRRTLFGGVTEYCAEMRRGGK